MPRSPGYRHNEETRQRIKAQQLINRLTAHALGDTSVMDVSQVNAAKALLNKVLPDLSAITLDGELNNTVRVIGARALSEDEWTATQADLGTAAGAARSTH